MKNYVQTLINEYDIKRNNALEELERKKQEIYYKFPRVREINIEIAKIGLQLARSVINRSGDHDKVISQMKVKIIDLKAEKGEILAGNGYPVDFLTIKYECNKCKDTGYIKNQKCSCFKQKVINHAYSQYNLCSILKNENFNTFNIKLYSNKAYKKEKESPRERMEFVYKTCLKFTDVFDKTNENLLFYGEPGLGKTFLANCIAKELLDKGKLVVYQTAFKLFDILRDYKFNSDKESFDKNQLASLLNSDLLIIDDLGTEVNNSFISSELFNIINTRLLNNKSTIISTNLTLSELKKNYSSRIISRILGNYNILKFYGEDIREKNI